MIKHSSGVPKKIDFECPDCKEETENSVMRAHGKDKVQLTLKCDECGRVHKSIIEVLGPIEVPVIHSSAMISNKIRMVLPRGEYFVGDDLMIEDSLCEITALEVGAKRVKSAQLEDVDTIWTKDISTVDVKVSLNLGRDTTPFIITTDPFTEFEIGSIVDLSGRYGEILAIKTKEKKITRGSAQAREIVRITCRPARK